MGKPRQEHCFPSDVRTELNEVFRIARVPHDRLLACLHAVHDSEPHSLRALVHTLLGTLVDDPLRTWRGSYLGALVQLFIESALADPLRERALFAFRALNHCLPRASVATLESLLERFDYGSDYRFPASDDFVVPPQVPTERVLDAFTCAEATAFPGVVHTRIANVLGRPDLPHKLFELEGCQAPCQGKSLQALTGWYAPTPLAELIDGTHFTAFIEDARLAFKVVSLLRSEYHYRVRDPASCARRRQRLTGAIAAFVASGEPLSADALLRLGSQGDHLLFAPIAEAVHSRELDVLVVDGPHIDSAARAIALPGVQGLFQCRSRQARVLVRDLEEEGMTSDGVLDRLGTLVHEWEHFRHTRRSSTPGSPWTTPIELAKCTPHDRLVSEMMSYLEEARWSLSCGSTQSWDVYDREGGVVLGVRNLVERQYLSD